MKRILAALLAAAILCLCAAAPAAAQAKPAVSQLVVNGQTLDCGRLPLAPYTEAGTVMVPLRLVGEALGYTVGWDAKTGAITIDDCYIQRATLFNRSAAAVFTGELKIIDMSREVTDAVPTVIHSGCTYVPLEFFREFFNDTAFVNGVVTIAPSTCELDGAGTSEAGG